MPKEDKERHGEQRKRMWSEPLEGQSMARFCVLIEQIFSMKNSTYYKVKGCRCRGTETKGSRAY